MEEIENRDGGKKKSPRKDKVIVRKNEMKLRKNEMKVRKNLSAPRWKIKNLHGGIVQFP